MIATMVSDTGESIFNDVEKSLSVLTTRLVMVCHKDEEKEESVGELFKQDVFFHSTPDESVFSQIKSRLLSRAPSVTTGDIARNSPISLEWVRHKLSGVAIVPHGFIPPDYASAFT